MAQVEKSPSEPFLPVGGRGFVLPVVPLNPFHSVAPFLDTAIVGIGPRGWTGQEAEQGRRFCSVMLPVGGQQGEHPVTSVTRLYGPVQSRDRFRTHREMIPGGKLLGIALVSTQKALSLVQEQLAGQRGVLGALRASDAPGRPMHSADKQSSPVHLRPSSGMVGQEGERSFCRSLGRDGQPADDKEGGRRGEGRRGGPPQCFAHLLLSPCRNDKQGCSSAHWDSQ